MKLLDQIIQQASTRELREIISRCEQAFEERKSKFKYVLKKFQTDFDITTGYTPLPELPKKEVNMTYWELKNYCETYSFENIDDKYGHELFTNDPEFKDIETVKIIE